MTEGFGGVATHGSRAVVMPVESCLKRVLIWGHVKKLGAAALLELELELAWEWEWEWERNDQCKASCVPEFADH